MKRLLLTLALVCPLIASTLNGPVAGPNTARPFTGKIIITPSRHWVSISGVEVAQIPVTLTVVAGSISAVDGVAATSLDFEPTDTASPAGVWYTFEFFTSSSKSSYQVRYQVPTSA